MKKNLIIIAIGLILTASTVVSTVMYFKELANSNRLVFDLKAANQPAKTFETKDGHQASKLIAQDNTVHELKIINPRVVSQLSNLYIAPRLVQSYSETTQTLKAEIYAHIKDSISATLPADTSKNTVAEVPVKIRMLEYSDTWISVKTGNIDLAPVKITVVAKDSIFAGVYKGQRRHPWAWILSRRQWTVAATNKSPYIKIEVIQAGVIKK
jgi:hypothetical protein